MELSKKTKTILKYCSTINHCVAFKKGSIIRNISENENIFFKAIIEESFPRDFQVFELGTLLSLINVFDEPFIDFDENYLTIKQNNSKTVFHYCSPSIVGENFDLSDKEIVITDPIAEFDLSLDQINTLYRMSSIMDLDCFRFHADESLDTKVTGLNAFGSTNNTHQYDTFTKASEPFSLDIDISIQDFTLLPTDYRVKISDDEVIEFHSEEYNLTYWVAGELTDE